MPPPAPSWGRTCPTATLPAADIWLTLSELSTWPRERLRPSQRLRLRLTPLCSTGLMASRECTTPPSTTTVTPLPTPATPGASTSLLTTTSATGSPSMARERLMLSPSSTDSRASSTTPTTTPTPHTLLPTPPTPSAPTGTSSSLLPTTEDMELSTTTELLSPLTSQPATQQD